ncbi:MAG: multicopper oxidase domain-containing protein [Gammaproteobacteria bacterium]|nr:multicopper oxidase domain-containing protein [Gammaproteobacteria bacterium]
MVDISLSKDAASAFKKRSMRFPVQLKQRQAEPDRAPSKRDAFEKAYDLFIRYTEGSIYNPTTQKYDRVRLRAYQQATDASWDAEQDGAGRFQAPAVVIEPGQTIRFKLYNQLPVQILPDEEPPMVPSVVCPPTAFNAPAALGCFNTTNLHTHGLWVSPSGNSDNVLLSINPSVNFEYEYNVPVDHPAGTFWYHPHLHGTTAMQVGSGMTGALVVYGERAPTATATGDLDTLLERISLKHRLSMKF